MLSLQETIRPSADLRNHYTVTLSYEEYKNMKARIELLEILAEAEDEVKRGLVAPVSETFDDLRKMLQEG